MLTYMKGRFLACVLERIRSVGLTGEEHLVQTQDGYLLTIFRIPLNGIDSPPSTTLDKKSGKHKLPVLLMHGLLCTSDMYLLDRDGLGFQLAREGFDVWLGNARGNAYSRRHTSLSPDDKEFWNFSWHEMGVYDVPAIVDYILDKTKENQVNYIGMSMGTTMFFVMGSMKPEYQRKVQTMVAIAPVARLMNFSETSSSSMKAHLLVLPEIWESKGKCELFPRDDFSGKSDHQIGCNEFPEPFLHYCCLLKETLAIVAPGGPYPSGTSLKVLRHFIQVSTTGKFQAFDYGNEELNKKTWNESNPPGYDLKRLAVPIAFFYTVGDNLVPTEDSEKMISELPNVIKVWKAPDPEFSHGDFILTTDPRNADAKINMTNELIHLMQERSA